MLELFFSTKIVYFGGNNYLLYFFYDTCDRILRSKPWSLYRDVSDEAQRSWFFDFLLLKRKPMEPMKKNDSSRIHSENQNGKNADDIQERMKKVEVKTSSPTSLLAKNSFILPTEVIRPKQSEQVKAKTETMSSSGSATGKNFFYISFLN